MSSAKLTAATTEHPAATGRKKSILETTGTAHFAAHSEVLGT